MTEKQSSIKRVIRAAHDGENPYVMILRATLQNRTLSYETRGLLAYLLSKPDDWEVMIEDLCQECGRGRVYRILKDLQDAKYLERIYHRDKTGKIVFVEYVAHEQPFIENPEMANPEMANPEMANPEMGKPKMGNRTLHNRDRTNKRKEENKDNGGKPLKPFDAMKNAIQEAFGYDKEKMTDAEWSLIGKSASQLIKAGATPADMKGLHKYCASRFDEFGAMALSTNWSKYQKEKTPSTTPLIADLPEFVPDMTPVFISAYQPQKENGNGKHE